MSVYFFPERDENKRRSSKSPGIKCVVVGDGTAGKTNLIQSYLLDSYVHDSSYIPTAFDKYNGEYIDMMFILFLLKLKNNRMENFSTSIDLLYDIV